MCVWSVIQTTSASSSGDARSVLSAKFNNFCQMFSYVLFFYIWKSFFRIKVCILMSVWMNWTLCREQRKFFISHYLSFYHFLVQYGVWSCQVITIFDWYKNFAVCTHEISIWRHVENTNKQCRVVRIRLRHQVKYKNV